MNTKELIEEMPNRFAKYKHTRRAYEFGRQAGEKACRMLNPAELNSWIESGSMARSLIESVENEDWHRVGHWQASASRDIGTHRGLTRLNRIEEIAETGCVASDHTKNGDGLTILRTFESPASSGVVRRQKWLMDETMEAYDRGYADSFAETIED